jgi:phosphohistidine phosphatase SixA
MAKFVELRRHTASDGDMLTQQGIQDAIAIGKRLKNEYDLLISSGAQRATQTLACLLAWRPSEVAAGVTIDARFRSDVEDQWFAAYKRAGAGDIESFIRTDPDLVEREATAFAQALRDVFDALPDGGRALVVGHSPMHEAAVYGLTKTVVEPISKGAGVLVTEEEPGRFRVEPLE